jgi:hypothetical protein
MTLLWRCISLASRATAGGQVIVVLFHNTVTIVRAEVSASKRAPKGVPHSS